MVTHAIKIKEICTINAEILSAWEKAECYEEEANHSQRNFTLIKNSYFLGFPTYMTTILKLLYELNY